MTRPSPKWHLFMLVATFCLQLVGYNTFSQTTFCPPNIDFENGNFGYWEFYTGSCCPINTPNQGVSTNRHTLTSGTGVDPIAGFPVVAPGGGQFSLKLGNSNVGAQAERARYFINVPSTATGNFILSYRYAVVFEDPGHPANIQPRFEVKAFDSATNNPLPCHQFTYVSSSNIPGFLRAGSSRVYYLPWTTGTINLTDYKGRTIVLDFRNADCGAGGHFGYSYIDMNCGLFEISPTICDTTKTDITLNAPPGYQSYQWRDSALTTVLGNTQSLTLPMPATPTVYAVILTPYPGFGCIDTLYTVYKNPKISVTPITLTPDTSMCEYDNATLNIAATGVDGPYHYEWTPATGLSCQHCPNPTVTGTKSTMYYVKTTNTLGCSIIDSVMVTVDTVEKAVLSPAKDSICQRDSVIIVNTNKKHVLNNSHTWIYNPATLLSGGGTDSFVKLHWTLTGIQNIYLTSNKGLCSYTDTTQVYVKPDFTFTMPGNDTICTGNQTQLIVNSVSTQPLTYSWVPSAGLSCNNCPLPIASPTTTTLYKLNIVNPFGCADSGFVRIKVDTTTETILVADNDSVCLNHGIGFINTGANPVVAIYVWSVDSGKIAHGKDTDSIHVFWNNPGYKKIKLSTTQGICNSTDSLQVYVVNYPRASFEVSSDGCIGKPMPLNPFQSDGSYHWEIDGVDIEDTLFNTQHNLLWEASGTYKIKLTLKYAMCSSDYEKDITIHGPPIAEIIVNNYDQICKGREFTLSATLGNRYSYAWEPALSFQNNTSPDVTVKAEKPQTYYLQVANQWGCISNDSVFIDAKTCCELLLPTAFTPNNDGHNDRFRPVNPEDKRLAEFMIANRRGQIVYRTTDIYTGWDGTHNGQPAGQDTYNYYISYLCDSNEELTQKGTVILLR